MKAYKQLSLFEDDILPPPKRKYSGGSCNPIVFHDYESYVSKFLEKEKTTDDTYTPKDVYEAVLRYVGEVYNLEGKEILRPFFPGGDYIHAEYPEDGVVIDNPPFSIFTKICKFYSEREIPFFLFGPGLTIASACKYCTALIVSTSLIFENKAVVKCNFVSNLFNDRIIMTAPRLNELLKACPSQNVKANLPIYAYPAELLSVSDMQTICNSGIDFAVKRSECIIVRDLDCFPKKGGLFGDHFLLSKKKAEAKLKAKALSKKKAANYFCVPLSDREKRIISELD